MYDTLAQIHQIAGYVVFLVVLVVAAMAFSRARNSREFEAGPFSFAMVVLDLQVTLGIVMYVVGQTWEADPAFAYIHPGIMLVALGIGHVSLARARREQMVVAAHRAVGRGLVVATLLIAVGIGLASAA